MLTLIYDKTCSIPDADTLAVARGIIEHNDIMLDDVTVHFGNECLFNAIRWAALEAGKAQFISIIFEGKTYQMNKYGAWPDWPGGLFGDTNIHFCEQILKTAMEMRREERNERQQQ